ncbi:MAG: bifunctional ornithine acetyltransferase/N-acetylglutamate synthase, partial [Gemmobacter sp.]
MGKTDWKTEAKALKAKLSRAKRRLREALGGEVMGGGADAQPPAAGTAKKAAPAVSPLAPASFPDLPEIAGARFAVAAAGVRYAGRTDVMVATLAPGSTLAGVFTRSATRAASVLDAQAKIGRGLSAPEGAAIVVNSGNSNAFTGRAGVVSVAEICAAAEAALGVPAAAVLTSST